MSDRTAEEDRQVKFQSYELDKIAAGAKKVHVALGHLLEVAGDQGYAPAALRRMVDALYAAGRAFTPLVFGERADQLLPMLRSSSPNVAMTMLDGYEDWPIEFCVLGEGDQSVFLADICQIIREPYYLENAAPALSVRTSHVPINRIEAGYAEDDSLSSACLIHGVPSRDTDEALALAPLLTGSLQDLHFLPELASMKSDQDIQAFWEWLNRARDVVHFNSHSYADSDNVRFLQVRSNAVIGPSDFEFPDGTDLDKRFYFLNSCSSVHGGVTWSGSVPEKLMNLGAEVVACTTGPVNDDLASRVAREFYRELAKPGVSASGAMLSARKVVNAKVGHPLANVYTLVGNGDFVLRRAS